MIAQELSGATLLTIGGAVATTLVGAISVLWKQTVDHNRQIKERSDKLEQKNAEVTSTLASVKEEVGELRGRQAGINDTCNLTMKAVREAIAGNLDQEE